jgi:hypothetical protein
MADKNTGIGREQVGSRSNEQVTGREGAAPAERAGEYATPEVGRRSTTVASTTASAPAGESTDARTRSIRAEIEQTREEMSETVNEIQDRLRPGTIASNAAESIRDAASERVNDLAESDSAYYIRANPIPAAMVGIGVAGLAWLAFGGRDADDARRNRYRGRSRWRNAPRRYEMDDRYRTSSPYSGYESGAYDYESPAVGREAGTASHLSARTSEMGRELRGTAGQASRRVQQRAYRAQSQLQRTWNESPLLIGAAAAVLGALIGSALPETERENQLMGDARDNMIEGVEQAVKGKVEEVQHAATDAVNQVQKAAGLTSPDDESPSTAETKGKTRSTGTTPGQTRSTSGH